MATVGLNQVAYISCPVGCAITDAPVFGNDIYSEDSSICKAGVHAGVIGNKGGDMKIQIRGKERRFNGIAKNGILSDSKGEYIRSFMVLGRSIPDVIINDKP